MADLGLRNGFSVPAIDVHTFGPYYRNKTRPGKPSSPSRALMRCRRNCFGTTHSFPVKREPSPEIEFRRCQCEGPLTISSFDGCIRVDDHAIDQQTNFWKRCYVNHIRRRRFERFPSGPDRFRAIVGRTTGRLVTIPAMSYRSSSQNRGVRAKRSLTEWVGMPLLSALFLTPRSPRSHRIGERF